LNLKKHLPLWLGQVYEGEWELVIVNDSSTDGTVAVVEDFQKEHGRLRLVNLVYKERAGKKQALAAGIRSATFDWLLFTDADCRPAGSGWIRGMAARMLATPDIRIVTGYGPLETPAGLLREWPRWEAIHTAVLYMTFAHAGMPYMGVGRNLAIHRSVYDAAGGFRSHEHIASGDDDLLVNAVANASNTALGRQNNLPGLAQAKEKTFERGHSLQTDTPDAADPAGRYARDTLCRYCVFAFCCTCRSDSFVDRARGCLCDFLPARTGDTGGWRPLYAHSAL
jgi:glycosyltransferase involved in cell wall biosynthesis